MAIDSEIKNPKSDTLILSEIDLKNFCSSNGLEFKVIDLDKLENEQAKYAFIHSGHESNQFNGGNTDHWMFLVGDKIFDSYGLQNDFLFPSWAEYITLRPKRLQEYGSNVCGEYCCTFYKFAQSYEDKNDENIGLEYCDINHFTENRNGNDRLVQQVYQKEHGSYGARGNMYGDATGGSKPGPGTASVGLASAPYAAKKTVDYFGDSLKNFLASEDYQPGKEDIYDKNNVQLLLQVLVSHNLLSPQQASAYANKLQQDKFPFADSQFMNAVQKLDPKLHHDINSARVEHLSQTGVHQSSLLDALKNNRISGEEYGRSFTSKDPREITAVIGKTYNIPSGHAALLNPGSQEALNTMTERFRMGTSYNWLRFMRGVSDLRDENFQEALQSYPTFQSIFRLPNKKASSDFFATNLKQASDTLNPNVFKTLRESSNHFNELLNNRSPQSSPNKYLNELEYYNEMTEPVIGPVTPAIATPSADPTLLGQKVPDLITPETAETPETNLATKTPIELTPASAAEEEEDISPLPPASSTAPPEMPTVPATPMPGVKPLMKPEQVFIPPVFEFKTPASSSGFGSGEEALASILPVINKPKDVVKQQLDTGSMKVERVPGDPTSTPEALKAALGVMNLPTIPFDSQFVFPTIPKEPLQAMLPNMSTYIFSEPMSVKFNNRGAKRLNVDGSVQPNYKKIKGAVQAYEQIQSFVPMPERDERDYETVMPFQKHQFLQQTAVPQVLVLEKGLLKAATNKI